MKFKIFVCVMLTITAIATATTAGALVYAGLKVKAQVKDVTSKIDSFNSQVNDINGNLQNINKTMQTTNTQLQKQVQSIPTSIPGL